MKRAVLPATLLATAPSLFALAETAGGLLTFEPRASIVYDSNVNGGTRNLSDVSARLTPAFSFVRKGALAQFQADAAIELIRYRDLSQYDNELPSASASFTLEEIAGRRITGTASVGYSESSDISDDVGVRIDSKGWNAGLSGVWLLGSRTRLGNTTSWSSIDREDFSDQDRLSSAFVATWESLVNDLNGRAGYTFGKTDSSRSLTGADTLDQTTHAVNAGLGKEFQSGLSVYGTVGYQWIDRAAFETANQAAGKDGMTVNLDVDGPFLPPRLFPKLTSRFSLSYGDNQSPGINDQGGRSLDGSMSLDWEARPETQVSFSVTKGRRLTVDDFTTDELAFRIGLNQKFLQRFTLTASLGIGSSDYEGVDRSDDRTEASLGTSYAFARVWTASLAYHYRNVDSSGTLARDTEQHLASLALSAKF